MRFTSRTLGASQMTWARTTTRSHAHQESPALFEGSPRGLGRRATIMRGYARQGTENTVGYANYSSH
jgi:hypothetical protein